MAFATHLPVELTHEILSYIDFKMLPVIARTCKSLSQVVIPLLYQEVTFTTDFDKPSSRDPELQNTLRLLRTLAGTPELCKHVRVFRYHNWIPGRFVPGWALDEIKQLCKEIVMGDKLLNLDTLDIKRAKFEVAEILSPLARIARTLKIDGVCINYFPMDSSEGSYRLKDIYVRLDWHQRCAKLIDDYALNSRLKLVSATAERIRIESIVSPKIVLENICFERASVLEIGIDTLRCKEECEESVSELLGRCGGSLQRLCLRHIPTKNLRFSGGLDLKQLLIEADINDSLSQLCKALPTLKQLTSLGIAHKSDFNSILFERLIVALGSSPYLKDLTITVPCQFENPEDLDAMVKKFGALLADMLPRLESLKIPRYVETSKEYAFLTMNQWAYALEKNKNLKHLLVGNCVETIEGLGSDFLDTEFINNLAKVYCSVLPELETLQLLTRYKYMPHMPQALEVKIVRDGGDITGVGRAINWEVKREHFWKTVVA